MSLATHATRAAKAGLSHAKEELSALWIQCQSQGLSDRTAEATLKAYVDEAIQLGRWQMHPLIIEEQAKALLTFPDPEKEARLSEITEQRGLKVNALMQLKARSIEATK